MDDKRLEFVAMILAGEEIKYLAPDAIRKRVREASTAYDIMVEELRGARAGEPVERNCTTCKHLHHGQGTNHCYYCSSSDGRPHWEPHK